MKRFSKPEQIKVGAIGYGGAFNMGRGHLNEMKAAGMVPTAVAEIDPSRLEVASKDFPGIQTYNSVARMLKESDVDLLAIITPHNTHAKLALQCLKAGRGVVSEKPLAITTAECDAMIAAAIKSKSLLSTYHNRHWDGCILEALQHIRAGEIGDVFRIQAHMGGYGLPGDWWRTSKSISGGILYDWGVHLLEYSLQILGPAKLTEVSGFAHRGFWADQTKWNTDTNEDEGFAVARFNTGAWVSLRITNLDSSPAPYWLEITGTKGSYKFDGRTYELSQVRKGKTIITKGSNQPSQGAKFYQNIADYLTGKADLIITPQWARRPIHLLDLANRSAVQNKALKAIYA